jgi:tetratricopeptide (TPR) repeat protein
MLDKEGTDGLETSPLDVEVNGTPMSVLLGQAVKLKSAQEKPLRKVFDSFPTFYQNSLFSGQDVVDIRALVGFEERLEAADKLKVLGNSLAKDGKYVESVNQYEMALSAITWIGNKKNHSWKSEGIKDDFIEEKHDAALAIDQPSNETQKLQKLQVTEHLISVYNNIAIVSTKTEQFTNAIAACTCALRLDERNVKALYLRSKARFTPKSCSVAEEEMAIRDLMAARKIDPQNKTVA